MTDIPSQNASAESTNKLDNRQKDAMPPNQFHNPSHAKHKSPQETSSSGGAGG
jgi:hypothetical protein